MLVLRSLLKTQKMIEKPVRFHSLSRRIVIQICLFTLVLSAVYGCISLILMYTLEDTFIERDIQTEASYLATVYEHTGNWPSPRNANMQLHYTKATFPDDFRVLAIEEPGRVEFSGDNGRHYHLYTFPQYDNTYLVAEVSRDLLVRPIRGGVIQFLSVSAFVVTLFACLIAWMIGRRTTRPLKELAELVGGVAPELMPKNFARQFPNNEVGILARALEESFHRIGQALEREKCFTRDVSHELRTPLAVIKNATELLKRQQTKNEGNIQVTQRIAEASEKMEKTVYTLLMLAREDNTSKGKENIRLMALIEQSVLDNSALLDGKNVDINISDTCNTQVYAQTGMLKVLLDNLLSNAFQYTDSGDVAISFIDDCLVVEDTGPGIEPSISNAVTEPAIKGAKSTGFGFGLSIVKRLCEHQGWQLTVTSSHGTRITVKFVSSA